MASQSEQSYGARLLRAQNLHNYISNFENYAPPRSKETAQEIEVLLQNILQANQNVSSSLQNYNEIVTERFNAFRKDDNSVFKILVQIRGAVQAQYGKDSIQFKQTDSIIKNIRSSRIVKIAATESTPENTVSQSEQSFGSTTQYFNNLLSTLIQFKDYNSSNTALQINNLQTFATRIQSLNKEVAIKYQSLQTIRKQRRTYYEDLRERVNRIKAYIKANYGIKSQEFILIKGIDI